MAPKSRPRFQGRGGAKLLATLQKHIRDPRAMWYDTSAKARRAPKYLLKHKDFILALERLQSNLSFPATVLKTELKNLVSDKGNWFETPGEQAKWIDTMQVRISRMARDSQRGRTNNPNAAWVKTLFAGGGDTLAETVVDDSDNEAPGDTMAETVVETPDADAPAGSSSFRVNFCRASWKPYRQRSEKSQKEFAIDWEMPVDAQAHDAMIGVWEDGFKHAVEDISVQDYKLRMQSSRAKREVAFADKCKAADAGADAGQDGSSVKQEKAKYGATVLWKGAHFSTGSDLVVSVRKNKVKADGSAEFICGFFENQGTAKKQLCQFVLTPGYDHDKIKALMINLAQKYSKGDVDKEALVQTRNDLAAGQGIAIKKPVAVPAAKAQPRENDQEQACEPVEKSAPEEAAPTTPPPRKKTLFAKGLQGGLRRGVRFRNARDWHERADQWSLGFRFGF